MSALTKMFIVLQLIFSLVCAVLLVLMVSTQQKYKTFVEQADQKNIALAATNVKAGQEKAAAQEEAADLKKQLATAMTNLEQANAAAVRTRGDDATRLAKLQADLDTANRGNQMKDATIAMQVDTNQAQDAELKKLRPQVTDLVKQYNELYRAKNESDNQLQRAELDIHKLQEMLAQGGGSAAGSIAPIGSEKQIQTISAAAKAGAVNAKISNLTQAQGRTLIEMPLGTRDGITVGTKMYVYRASGYVGDATVENVSPQEAVAVMTSTKAGETAHIGDLVSTVEK